LKQKDGRGVVQNNRRKRRSGSIAKRFDNALSMNKLLKEADKYYLRGAIISFWNLIIDRGEGAFLYTLDGQRYLDYSLGGGPMILGHSHPAVVKAVQRQVEKGSHFHIPNQAAIELSEEIVQASPCADKVTFVNSGSEAVLCALRLARAFTQKDKILRFEGAYNGFTDEMLRSSSFANPEEVRDYPLGTYDSAGIPRVTDETVLVAPYNDIETTKRIVEDNEDDLAGIIVEPVQRLITPRPNFLGDLRKLTSKKGIVLVFDEIVTGFRLAYGGAQEFYNVVPDLATYGKIIGGGFPIGAIGGKAEIMALNSKESAYKVFFLGTYSGNPVSCKAGLVTLQELRKRGVYDGLRRYGAELRAELAKIFRENRIAAQILGEGPMSGYAFTENKVTCFRSWSSRDREMDRVLTQELLKNGLITDVPKLYNSTCHGDKEMELTLEVFRKSTKAAVRDTVQEGCRRETR
jgi:glutamate-1-semialdehyde 2,1-aminomutase